MCCLLGVCLCVSPRPAPPQVSFIAVISANVVIVLLGFTYSVVSPIISIFIVVYFSLNFLVFKYQACHTSSHVTPSHLVQCMYVYLPNFESGGVYFPKVFSWTVVAMFIFQLTIAGIVSLKQAPIQAAMLVPLPIITIAFYFYCMKHFNEPAKFLTAFEAKKLVGDGVVAPEDGYIQPALTEPKIGLPAALTDVNSSDA